MALRILKTRETSVPPAACLVIPCVTKEDAVEAFTNAGIEGGDVHRLIDACDPASEDNGQIYLANQRIFMVGLGKSRQYGKVKQAFQVLSGKLRGKKIDHYVLMLAHLSEGGDLNTIADAAVNGLCLGRYDFGQLKSGKDKEANPFELDVVTGSHDLEQTIRIAEAAALTQQSIYALVNLPSSHKTPEVMANWARNSAAEAGYEVDVLEEKELRERGFEALLAVNRGSEFPARLVISRYNGTTDPAAPLLAFVGKGVTFDTGGVNIKTGDSMHLMKSDMGGAAAALGAVELLARAKAPVRVMACAPCTDNSIGTKAIKPGDVIHSYSGKTIEVINTDAEGRLILADALSYVIRQFKPVAVVDLATLTGSIIRTLGSHCAGLFTHSDTLAAALTLAGDTVGERLWRLPIWEDYADEMKSEIADVRNLSDKPAAGAITAAKFLENFVEEHPQWAHLDIAGTAFKANGVSKGHVATAYGVRLLYEFACNFSRE